MKRPRKSMSKVFSKVNKTAIPKGPTEEAEVGRMNQECSLIQQDFKESKTQYIKQICRSILLHNCNFSHTRTGIVIKLMYKLNDADLPVSQTRISKDATMVSCVFLSGLITNLVTGFFMDYFGPCTLVLMVMPPVIISYIAQAVFLNLWVLFIGRILIGSMSAVLCAVVQSLVAELCCPKIRGFVSSMPELFVSVGILYVYICAQYLPFRWVTGLCAAPTCLNLLTLFIVPESPYWLVSKGRIEMAKRTLKDLYGNNYQKELIEITNNIETDSTFKAQVKEISLPQNYKPVTLVIILFSMKELAGYQFIFSYAGYLFKESDISIDSAWFPILIGLCRVTFTFISAFTVDRKGRRPLLSTSAIFCGLSLLAGGLSLSLDQHLPCVVAVLVFIASFSLGEGPIVWILLGELVPLSVRAQGSNLVVIFFAIGSFCSTLIYPKLQVKFGLDVIFYICAFFNILLFLFVWFFIPETKNASLFDVKNKYEKCTHKDPEVIKEESDKHEHNSKSYHKGYDNFGMQK
ncbi:unnamed protein product, partial [Meganyctiphanes norvegica]